LSVQPAPEGAAATLLARHAEVLVTMDDRRREIRDGAILVRGGAIAQVGSTAELPASADRVLDLTGHVLLPGLVNTHHHMFQTLTRAVPAAQDSELFGWLRALYPVWARLTPEAIRVSALTAMAELLLSGCTTSSDHLYVFPNGCRLDDTIDARRDEPGRNARRAAAGCADRKRGRDHRRCPPRHRGVSRPGTSRDGARRRRAVLSVQRHP
jgi:8-oxoguanine deaminase